MAKKDERAARARKTRRRASSRPTPELSASRVPAPDLPIVGIGASAGGLEALEEFFANMPADTGMAFVVVTHLLPGHASMLPELLGRKATMSVVEATDGLKLEPNRVYVGPPGGYLAILNGVLHRMETEQGQSPKLPIDYFLRSLAEDRREKGICVILSGTGTDGTLGLRAIKGESGMAMVEQPQSAKYAGMPSNAIATGQVDYVLPPAAMPAQLIAYVQSPYMKHEAFAGEPPTVAAEPLQKLFVLLRSRTGNDFSSYKLTTLRRRIGRRMSLRQIKEPDQYVRYLKENPQEIDILFKELLISVTSFFRDPAAWDALVEPLVDLVRSRPDHRTLRAWVPGCSTGEEVFSLAIALRECCDRVDRNLGVQLFGSDLDAAAIETARAGHYASDISADVSPTRLERYFARDDSGYRIRKEVRELAIFAPHNLIKDPPFTRLDIISCRNLLIYLNTDLQKKLLPIFHYALNRDGLLFLGPSESVGSFTHLFEPLDKRWKIFRRRECVATLRAWPQMPLQTTSAEDAQRARAATAPHAKPIPLATVVEQLLLARFVPVSVVVTERGDILYIHGKTGAYLEPSPGEPRNNLLEMAREGLQIELTAAIRQCVTKGSAVEIDDVKFQSGGQVVRVNLAVEQLREPEPFRGLLLVSFQPSPSPPERPGKPAPPGKPSVATGRFEALERELQHMRESHRATLEELETANEELKSANEELQSTNEELQSTNEELETSKEEMQSLNEELTTLNAELQARIEDLSQANDDMQNLLNSTDIATVFLDNELNIKRFTEQAKHLAMIRPADIGRPISDLALNLEPDELAADCRAVLRTLVSKECAVHTKNGSQYLMRIRPYRTSENTIEGLVLTFVDINRLKVAEAAARQVERHRRFSQTVVETLPQTTPQPLLVLDEALRVDAVNQAFCLAFRLTHQEVEGQLIYELGHGQWNDPSLRALLESILPQHSTITDFRIEHDVPDIGRRVFLLNARRLAQEPHLPGLILLSLQQEAPHNS